MKKQTTKKHTVKKRTAVLLIALSATLIAFLLYTVIVGKTYSYTEVTGLSALDQNEISAESSDESILKVVSVKQLTRPATNILKVTVEGVSGGDSNVTLRYPSEEPGGKTVAVTSFHVLPFNVVYDLTFDSFSSLNALVPFFIPVTLLVIIVLLLSFREKQKTGDFSYSMVVVGGIILFLLIDVIITFTDQEIWNRFYESLNVKDILAMVVSSGIRFVNFSAIPVLLLAAALAISNVMLIVKEGFRPQNLLGVFIGVLIAAGMAVIQLSKNYHSIESEVLYYLAVMINLGAAFLLCYFECMFLSTMFCAVASTLYKPPYNLDYIIILGCAIRQDGTPTPILRGRVQRAFDFEQQQYRAEKKHAVFVPSGGRGSDEIISEAESMKRCLMEMGVPEERILKEDRSVNTYQNMAFSKKIIEENAAGADARIGFSTTNYHVFRGYTLAEKLNFKVKGMSAKTKLYFFPNAFVREFIGLLWEKKWAHLLFIILFFVFLLILYIIIRY